MRNLFVLGILAAVLSSCSTSGNGELIGVQNRPIWNPTDPYGWFIYHKEVLTWVQEIKMYRMHM